MRYLLPLLLILAGCATEKHRAEKTLQKLEHISTKYRAKSPIDTADTHWCMVKFPVTVKEGVTIYKQGRPIVTTHTDTVTVNCDTIRTIVRIPCPPRTTIIQIDTLYKHDTLIDSRQVAILGAKVKSMGESITDKDNALKSQRKGLILGWLIVGVMVVLYVIKRR